MNNSFLKINKQRRGKKKKKKKHKVSNPETDANRDEGVTSK